jgi:hypothetical protein
MNEFGLCVSTSWIYVSGLNGLRTRYRDATRISSEWSRLSGATVLPFSSFEGCLQRQALPARDGFDGENKT